MAASGSEAPSTARLRRVAAADSAESARTPVPASPRGGQTAAPIAGSRRDPSSRHQARPCQGAAPSRESSTSLPLPGADSRSPRNREHIADRPHRLEVPVIPALKISATSRKSPEAWQPLLAKHRLDVPDQLHDVRVSMMGQ